MNTDLSLFFSGEKLYGDDFSLTQILDWYADEEEGYANLGAKFKDTYKYGYHEVNKLHGFRHLPTLQSINALGIGSAYGDEFFPIANRLSNVTILDPSDTFSIYDNIHGVPCNYSKPNPSGDLPFASNHFNLVTSFGVMHHIPNVSHVIQECYRCLSDGGMMLIREPIHSMGDWQKPRQGLTKRERGIPAKIMLDIIHGAGFNLKSMSACMFPLFPRIGRKLGFIAYNSKVITLLDLLVSSSLKWNTKYHRTNYFEKFAPSSYFYVLEK